MRVTRIIVALVFLITLAGFYSLYKYLKVGLEAQTLQATEEAMVDQVHILSGILETQIENDQLNLTLISQGFSQAKQHTFEATIYRMAKTKMGANFYITDPKGIVVFDSDKNKRIGKDYSQKIDVLRTLDGRYGARSSREDKEDETSSIMYIGAPIKSSDGKTLGVISLYKPQGDVSSFIEDRRQWILLALILIGFGISSFTVAVFVWLFRPLGKLTNYAKSISKGERPNYPRLGKGREVNTLGSALKNMRESLEGRDYLENYVQMLTHELKSPLSAIKGAAELLDEEMPPKQRAKFLSNIRQETERSQQIIDGLLKLSKLESLSQLQINEHLEVSQILEGVRDDNTKLCQQKGIDLKIQCDENHTIHGDQMSILTAISNMLSNAIEFSPENSSITIKTLETDRHVEITVEDQGTGIPDYALERVFDNFYSIARPSTGKKSSGLGLAFVREVAHLHQGFAKVKNNALGGVSATLAIRK